MKLNVILVTYNHSKYIEESLHSILLQKTDFDFNILIADDKSTDDTLERIKACEKQTKIPFCYLESKKNLGITKNYQHAFRACDAEYVAVMEGDDLWTDPCRLQKHVDFLENHLECTMSFNRYIVSDFGKSEYTIQPCWETAAGYQLLTSRDLAKDNLIGNFSTCVYRKSAIDALPESLFDMTAYDWITNIMVGKNGMIGYLTTVMSIYRIHANGVWSGAKQEENIKDTINGIKVYDEFTAHIYTKEFDEHTERLKARLMVVGTLEIINAPKVSKIRLIIKRLKDFVPPILIWVVKLIVPPKILKKLF